MEKKNSKMEAKAKSSHGKSKTCCSRLHLSQMSSPGLWCSLKQCNMLCDLHSGWEDLQTERDIFKAILRISETIISPLVKWNKSVCKSCVMLIGYTLYSGQKHVIGTSREEI